MRVRLLTKFLFVSLLVLLLAHNLRPAASPSGFSTPSAKKSAEELYLQLRNVQLDPTRVYEVRDAALDYPKLHLTLDDGKIGFTTDVYGKVTGAFFEGDGELLVFPPDQAERASMTLFTGAAILEERFRTAYFRFNDDAFANLKPNLRDTTSGKDFVGEWGDAARNLATTDALRLFLSFSRCLPGGQQVVTVCNSDRDDRFLHARIQGSKLGIFDVNYDALAAEQISIGQQKLRDGINYYNTWTQFAVTPERMGEWRPSDEVAIRSYQIDVQVNPPTNLHANATVKVDVVKTGMRAVLFELSRHLKLSAVTLEGTPLEFIQNQAVEGTQLERRGNDLVAIVFPEPLQAGQNLTLNFEYGGDVLSEAGGGLLYVGARGIWYPNRGMAAADFDLRFRYPAGWSLLATGARVSTDEGNDAPQSVGEKSSRWVTKIPIPVAGFNLGKYSKVEARAQESIVETYAAAGVERTFPKAPIPDVAVPRIPTPLPPLPHRTDPIVAAIPVSPARNAQMVADTAASAVNFYSERFGPYPYGTLRLTQMPGTLSQGWPGLVFLSSYSFLLPDERARLEPDLVSALLSQQVTAHETAHQWWGDLVYWQGYRDQWLFEGLANYCALMILESQNPVGFHRVMSRYRDNLLERNKAGAVLKDAGPVTLGLRLSSSEFPDGYEAISYGRGTWMFHMIRHMLDDVPLNSGAPRTGPSEERFASALHNLREHYAGKPVTTRQVLQEFAEELPAEARYEGKKRLDWFYGSWINGTAVPHLQLENVKFAENGRTISASGTIVQKDVPIDMVTSVPIFAQLSGSRRVLVGRIFADGPEASFKIFVPAGTRKLLLDPDETVLRN